MEQPDGPPSENTVHEHKLTPRAESAMLESCMREALSPTDLMCRALIVYNDIGRLVDQGNRIAAVNERNEVLIIKWVDDTES